HTREIKGWIRWAGVTSECTRETVRTTTSVNRFVSTLPLTGATMASASASTTGLTSSKFRLGISSEMRYFPAARTELSDMNGFIECISMTIEDFMRLGGKPFYS